MTLLFHAYILRRCLYKNTKPKNIMSQTVNLPSIHRLVWTGLLAALTAVGAAIAIPLGPLSPVPVTLQTMFVLLSGLILGSRGGAIVILLYFAAGALGLPIFAGGKAGLAAFLGPTGGFLIGFLPCAMLAGLGAGAPTKPAKLILLYCAVGTSITLAMGTVHLMLVMDISLAKALAVGVTPFLPGAALKCLAATTIYRFLASRRLLPV